MEQAAARIESPPSTTLEDVRRRVRDVVREERLAQPRPLAAMRWFLGWSFGVGATMAAIVHFDSIPIRAALCFVLCMFVPGAGALVHECAHRNLIRARAPQLLLAWFAGLLAGLPGSVFRPYHLDHHRNAVTPEDPEGMPPVSTTIGGYLWAFFTHGALFVFVLGFFVYMTGFRGRPPQFLRPEMRRELVVGGFLHFATVLGLLVMIALGHTVLVWLFLIPHLSGIFFWLPFLLTSEHYAGTPGPVLTNTRTIRSNAILRAMFWNTNYHVEHHLVPQVPSSVLPRIHELVKDHAILHPGYWSFHRSAMADIVSRASAERSAPKAAS